MSNEQYLAHDFPGSLFAINFWAYGFLALGAPTAASAWASPNDGTVSLLI
jgi:hypothetical protein